MKIKLGELRAAIESINDLLQEKLPTKAGYWFGKTVQKLVKEHSDFEKSRMKLVDQYAKKDENGKPIFNGNRYELVDEETFTKEYFELATIEIDVTFTPFKLESLGDISPKGTTTTILTELGFLYFEDEKAEIKVVK